MIFDIPILFFVRCLRRLRKQERASKDQLRRRRKRERGRHHAKEWQQKKKKNKKEVKKMLNQNSKIIKLENYEALKTRVDESKAKKMADCYALLSVGSIGCNVFLFDKNGNEALKCNTSFASSLYSEQKGVQIDDDGKAYFLDFTGKKYFVNKKTKDAYICPDCGKLMPKNKAKKHRCRAVAVCSGCGQVIDPKIIKKYGKRKRCPHCHAESVSFFTGRYESKVDIDFINKQEHFGLEIEIDDPTRRADRDDASKQAGKLLNIIEYYKKPFVFAYDGSLTHGIEIKTSPRPLKWWQENKAQLQKGLDKFATYGFKGHDTTTTGLHISISTRDKDDFFPLKLAMFWNLNIKFFDVVCRRTSTFNCFYKKKDFTKKQHELTRYAYDISHSDAINLQHLDDGRIELRHFKSTMLADSLVASVDIVNAVVEVVSKSKYKDIKNGKIKMQAVVDKLATEEGRAYIKAKMPALNLAGYVVEVA